MALQQVQLANELGISPAVVSRLKAKGMPVHDVEAARRWREANVRARITVGQRAERPAAPDSGDDDGGNDYWTNRARRERAEADLAELKLAEQCGELVRAADVRSHHQRKLAALRDALLQIPARLASVLAAENDAARCHDALQQELHGVLAQIAEAG